MALSAAQTAIVKSTAPILKEQGTRITTLFYKNMISAHPELRNIFNLANQHSGDQPRALANAVLSYAQHIDDLGALSPAVERIAQRHVSLRVLPEQYPIVGKHLLGAIAEVLGPALTPGIAEAWTAAYNQLASVFIHREAEMYSEEGEWVGWRRFRVEKREKESPLVDSFYLVPEDGRPLPACHPGQYVSVRVKVSSLDGIFQCRQYSLSEAPRADRYRISVKRQVPSAGREDDRGDPPAGLVSNLLHDNYKAGDVVEMSFPRGDFTVDVEDPAKADVPLVLMSAGVGVTPEMSILDAVLSPESKVTSRPIHWIHAARNGEEVPFGQHVRKVAGEKSNVGTVLFLEKVKQGEEKGRDFDFDGIFDLNRLDRDEHLSLQDPRTDYYVCGPQSWMLAVRDRLEEFGVKRGRIHMELFGTGDVND
ncbi:hemoglobin, partial [Sodiomyces alkalinus F11]